MNSTTANGEVENPNSSSDSQGSDSQDNDRCLPGLTDHLQRIFAFGVTNVPPNLQANEHLDPQAVAIANALLAVLWSSIPSLSQGNAMKAEEEQAILSVRATHPMMSSLLIKLARHPGSERDLKTQVCDFFTEFFDQYQNSEGGRFISDLEGFYDEMNRLKKFDGKVITVPDTKALHEFHQALVCYVSVQQSLSQRDTEVTNPLQSLSELNRPLSYDEGPVVDPKVVVTEADWSGPLKKSHLNCC